MNFLFELKQFCSVSWELLQVSETLAWSVTAFLSGTMNWAAATLVVDPAEQAFLTPAPAEAGRIGVLPEITQSGKSTQSRVGVTQQQFGIDAVS